MRQVLKWTIVLLAISLSFSLALSQTRWDDYYPLHQGDYWEYVEYLPYPVTITHQAVGDTLMPNAVRYKTISVVTRDGPYPGNHLEFERVDSLGNVFGYISVSCRWPGYWSDTLLLTLAGNVGDSIKAVCRGPNTIWILQQKDTTETFGRSIEFSQWNLLNDVLRGIKTISQGFGLSYYGFEGGDGYLRGAKIGGKTYGTLTTVGQDFVYPLAVGDRWQLVQIMPPYGYSYMEFEVKGDSVMPNGYTYARFNDGPTFRRQQGNQVLVFSPADNKEYVMYDFSRPIGDTVGAYPLGAWLFKVVLRDSSSSVAYGQRRKTFTFYHISRNATDVNTLQTIVDGIGLTGFDGFVGPYSFGGAVISGKSYGTIVNVLQTDSPQPQSFSLRQNYPNPFNPTTAISYQLLASSFVTLKVTDVLGREVALLVNERQSAGEHQATWNASGVSSGIYFYRLKAGEYVETKKMILLR